MAKKISRQIVITPEPDIRTCNACNKIMNEGYCIEGGAEYYCNDSCLHTKYTAEQWMELYGDGDNDSYWTTWEEAEQGIWQREENRKSK